RFIRTPSRSIETERTSPPCAIDRACRCETPSRSRLPGTPRFTDEYDASPTATSSTTACVASRVSRCATIPPLASNRTPICTFRPPGRLAIAARPRQCLSSSLAPVLARVVDTGGRGRHDEALAATAALALAEAQGSVRRPAAAAAPPPRPA